MKEDLLNTLQQNLDERKQYQNVSEVSRDVTQEQYNTSQCHTFPGYNQRRSNRLKRGIAKYVRPSTSIIVISMLVSNGDCPK
jgi:hypothetical protein